MSDTNHIRIRMYRQGLGDCFLLRFPSRKGKYFHMVIDSGVLKGTRNAKITMTEIAQDIARESNGKLDLLVVTHEHWDHVSGFAEAREIWKELQITNIWLAWTEKPGHPLAEKLRNEREARKAEITSKFAALCSSEAQSLYLDGERNARVASLLGFLGVNADGSHSSGTAEALQFIVGHAGKHIYCSPGDTLKLPSVDHVRIFVLGPPEDEKLIKRSDPDRRASEVYDDLTKEHAFAMRSADEERDEDLPFPPSLGRRVRGEEEYQRTRHEFFGEYDEPWQQLSFESISEIERLAMALDGDTNNTSLALAFEVGDGGPVLLFPADAQVGNWISWRDVQWKDGARTITTDDLLARTVLYKVGHHGSHNATMREHGLEKMTHRDLIALIPVSKALARKKKWKMPFPPLYHRLIEKTRGRVLLSDADEAPPDPKLLERLTPTERKRFREMVTTTELFHDVFIPMENRGGVAERDSEEMVALPDRASLVGKLGNQSK